AGVSRHERHDHEEHDEEDREHVDHREEGRDIRQQQRPDHQEHPRPRESPVVQPSHTEQPDHERYAQYREIRRVPDLQRILGPVRVPQHQPADDPDEHEERRGQHPERPPPDPSARAEYRIPPEAFSQVPHGISTVTVTVTCSNREIRITTDTSHSPEIGNRTAPLYVPTASPGRRTDVSGPKPSDGSVSSTAGLFASSFAVPSSSGSSTTTVSSPVAPGSARTTAAPPSNAAVPSNATAAGVALAASSTFGLCTRRNPVQPATATSTVTSAITIPRSRRHADTSS